MRNLRSTAILLLVLYSSLVLGMNFHSHAKEQQVSPHCKICEFSQTFATQPSHIISTVEMSRLGTVSVPNFVLLQQEPLALLSARSPPLS